MSRRFWSDAAAEREVDRREAAAEADVDEPCVCTDCGPRRT